MNDTTQPELSLDARAFPDQLAELLRGERVAEVMYARDQEIFTEGDDGHEAFFVVSGSVSIIKRDERGEPRLLDVLEEGAMFGEMALLDQPRRSATAKAATDTNLFVIPRSKAHDLIAHVPQMAIWLLEIFSRRLRRADTRLAQMEKVQEVATRVIAAQQAERAQLAREILEGPAEEFSDWIMRLDFCLHVIDKDPAQIKPEIAGLKTAMTRGLSRLRNLVQVVTPEAMKEEGLETLLRNHAERVQRDTGLKIQLNCPSIGPDALDFAIQNTVFCVVQAALTNIQTYGSARHVELVVALASAKLSLQIADDGPGFEMAKVRAGFYREEMENFEAMRERVQLVGGAMRLKSQPGKGTLVDVTIPLTQV
jgi:signal transduction histidine kinase